ALLKPFLPILEVVAPTRWHKTSAHETGLTSVETDDVTILFRYFDGYFLYGFFLAFHDEDLLDGMDPKIRDTTKRDYDWLEAVWRRSMIGHDSDTIIAKVFSLGLRLPSFLERFPDARVLYMVRDPVSTIPSGMSLVSGVLDNAFGFWSLPEATRERWLERLYQGLVTLMNRFTEDWNAGLIDRDRVFVVQYDRMMSDFDGLMDDMHAFLEHEPTEAQLEAVGVRAAKQRAYQSKHKYDLSKFNLDEDRIRRDCAPFYETFLADKAAPSSESAAP
ncbi:MAG: sulfotransferase, partial [Myxococcota bacterium]